MRSLLLFAVSASLACGAVQPGQTCNPNQDMPFCNTANTFMDCHIDGSDYRWRELECLQGCQTQANSQWTYVFCWDSRLMDGGLFTDGTLPDGGPIFFYPDGGIVQ